MLKTMMNLMCDDLDTCDNEKIMRSALEMMTMMTLSGHEHRAVQQ